MFGPFAGLHLAAVVGALALVTTGSWPLLPHRKYILAVQAAGSGLFGLHYLLLGAWTGAIMCAAAIVQSVTAVLVTKRNVRFGIAGFTLLVTLTLTVLTWGGLRSAVAQMAGLLSLSGRLQCDAQRLRWFFLGSVFCSMTYNLLVGSPWGLSNDTIALTMLIAGLWRERNVRMRVAKNLETSTRAPAAA